MAVFEFPAIRACCQLSTHSLHLGNGAPATSVQFQDVYCQHSSPVRRRRDLYRRGKARVVRLVQSVLSNNHAQKKRWCRAAAGKRAAAVSFPMGLGQALEAVLDQTWLSFKAFVPRNSTCECGAEGSSILLVLLQCCLSALSSLTTDPARLQPTG